MSSVVSAQPPGGLHTEPELTSAKDQRKARALGLTDLHGRSQLSETDLNADEFVFLVEEARRLRADKRRGGDRVAARGP